MEDLAVASVTTMEPSHLRLFGKYWFHNLPFEQEILFNELLVIRPGLQ